MDALFASSVLADRLAIHAQVDATRQTQTDNTSSAKSKSIRNTAVAAPVFPVHPRRKSSLASFPPVGGPHATAQAAFTMSNSNAHRAMNSTRVPAVRGSNSSSNSSSRPSRGSSISAPQQQISSLNHYTSAQSLRRPRSRLKSQYPADSPENHVEYILVASFDIDRGSTMEHQYPGPISGDETMLAELMLPDQAHTRTSDWTIFFLHKDTSAEEEAREERRERRRRRRLRKEALDKGEPPPEEVGEEDDEEGAESDIYDTPDEEEEEGTDAPLIYVLNLVFTKHDEGVKRGAVVKAMAICTRHSFLHIYKPLLLLALENYFKAPVPETLAQLYDAVNAMDLSLMPRLSMLERFVLSGSTAKDMFIEKFDQMIKQRMEEDKERISISSPDSATAMSRAGRYKLPRDTHEFESTVIYNGVPIPIKVPTSLSFETVGNFSLIKLITTFSTPHTTQPQPFALHAHLTTSGAYTHPIIVLVNALLTQKKVIFVGHNMKAMDVAEAVLAACALASGGMLRGFTRHAFPYTDLTKIDDLLKVPGFIAGVTNPAFSHKAEWWDLLCDLSTGRMKISHRIVGPEVSEGLLYFQQLQNSPNTAGLALGGLAAGLGGASGNQDPCGDNAFMDSLLSSIANRHGEAAIRSKWRDWVLKFTRIAAAFEECVYGASALHVGTHETDAGIFGVTGHGYVWSDEASRLRELAANVYRVEGWRVSRSYYSFVQDIAATWPKRPVRGIDFAHQHERLRSQKLSHDASAAIYLALARSVEDAGFGFAHHPDEPNVAAPHTLVDPPPNPLFNTSTPITPSADSSSYPVFPPLHSVTHPQLQYDTILQLLASLPEVNNGLFYISLGLFHPRLDVRAAVVRLLDRIRDHEAGRHLWESLGKFPKLAMMRIQDVQKNGVK